MRTQSLKLLRAGLLALSAPVLCWAQGYSITTIAGGGSGLPPGPATGTFVAPLGVAVDATGNVYVSSGGEALVLKVTPSGNISIFAGVLGQGGYSGDGGPATNAELGLEPEGLAFDAAGNLYIADAFNGRVRKVGTDGTVTTVAGGGTPTPSYGDGGPATQAYIGGPYSVAVDAAGNLYIADRLLGRVRKVAPDGTITTFAGGGVPSPSGSIGDGGPATSASLLLPTGVAVDAAGNVYIADTFNNRIREVSNGIITTVAGSGSGSYSGDGGAATSAGISGPQDVKIDAAGNLYIADTGDDRIRMVAGGTISTIAGNGSASFSGDNGPATSAGLNMPVAVAIDKSGNIYIADEQNGRVRLLTAAAPPGGSPPSITAGGVVSASAFGQFHTIAPGTWIEIYGANLAVDSRGWTGSDFNGVNAPTSLDGTSVTVGGQSAFIDYISPLQVNAQVPSNVGTGSQSLIVATKAGASSAYTVTVNATQPGLFAPPSFNVGGKQYVGALFSDGVTYAIPPGAIAGVPSRRAQPGDDITLYGIGFGSVAPNTPAGQIVPAMNSLTLPFNLLFGGTQAQVTYDGLAPGAVGLYQFNAVVPNVTASDTVPLTFTLGGVSAGQTLYIAVE